MKWGPICFCSVPFTDAETAGAVFTDESEKNHRPVDFRTEHPMSSPYSVPFSDKLEKKLF